MKRYRRSLVRQVFSAVLAMAVLLPGLSWASSIQITEYSPLISIGPVNCFFTCPATQTVTGPIVNGVFNQQIGSTSAPNPEASLNTNVSADGSAITASGATIAYTGGNNPYSIDATSQVNINFTLSETVNYALHVALPVSNQATSTSSVSFYYLPPTGPIAAIYSAQNQNSVFNPPFSSAGLFLPGQYILALSAVASGYGMDRTVAEVSAGYSFDLEMTPVPIPGTVWLLLSGVGYLGVLVQRRRRELASSSRWALAALAALAAFPAEAQRYSVTVIHPIKGDTHTSGAGINDHGQVAGTSSFHGTPIRFRAFLYNNGIVTGLGAVPGCLLRRCRHKLDWTGDRYLE